MYMCVYRYVGMLVMALLAFHSRLMSSRAALTGGRVVSANYPLVVSGFMLLSIPKGDDRKIQLKSETGYTCSRGRKQDAVDHFVWLWPTERRIGANEASRYKVAR